MTYGSLVLGARGINNFTINLVGNASPTSAPPVVQLVSPANGSTFYDTTPLLLSAVITSAATNISCVTFEASTPNGPVNLGQSSVSPYLLHFANVPDGDYTLTAVAVDAAGCSGTASPVTIHIVPANGTNQLPVAVNDQFTVLANSQNNILRYPQVNIETLLKLRIPIFIRGGAGAGKTTFLRHICQQYDLNSGKANSLVPILISLVQANIKSQEDIIEECLKRLRELSYPITESQLGSRLQAGEFIILFDGLDETGAGSELVFSEIKKFSEEHPNLPTIVTGRDSYTYSKWADAAQFRVTPFSFERLGLFIQNWFTSEPSKVDRIMSWLSSNQKMRDAACTPIIAALLCSLVGADADLPCTEVELYEQRFELLLGRWEKAKGGASMSAPLRKRYWHFITLVTYVMHIETRRTIDYAQLLKTAKAFYDENYHGNADNFVNDCVHRNLLFQEPKNQFSFGHLTYQEFLVAKHLANDNPIDFILHRLDQPWWSKTLEFYAAMKGDITSLLMKALVPHRSDGYLKKLIDLCSYASFTPKEARDRVMDAYTRPVYAQMSAIVGKK
jgi:hypothetical protein